MALGGRGEKGRDQQHKSAVFWFADWHRKEKISNKRVRVGFFSFHLFFLLSFCFFLVLLLLSFSILFSLRLEGSSPRPSRPQLRCTTWVRFFCFFTARIILF